MCGPTHGCCTNRSHYFWRFNHIQRHHGKTSTPKNLHTRQILISVVFSIFQLQSHNNSLGYYWTSRFSFVYKKGYPQQILFRQSVFETEGFTLHSCHSSLTRVLFFCKSIKLSYFKAIPCIFLNISVTHTILTQNCYFHVNNHELSL